MIGKAADVAAKLVNAPGAGATHEQILKWRMLMAGTMLAIAITMAVHVAWACGVFDRFGVSGFAIAADVEKAQEAITAKLNSLEASQKTLLKIALAQEICRIYRLQQEATGVVLLQQLDKSLAEKQDEYSELAGGRYPLAECAPAG